MREIGGTPPVQMSGKAVGHFARTIRLQHPLQNLVNVPGSSTSHHFCGFEYDFMSGNVVADHFSFVAGPEAVSMVPHKPSADHPWLPRLHTRSHTHANR